MAALRRTGDTFASDDGNRLVTGGVTMGRRRVAARRAGAITGGVLAIALVSVGGVYAVGAVGGGAGGAGDRGNGGSSVAAPAVPTPGGSARADASAPPAGGLSGEELAAVFENLTPEGRLTEPVTRGTTHERGPLVSGVYDDGKGKAAVSMGFYRNGPEALECPDKVFTPYDACSVEKLPGDATLMVFQGYEYPDKREPTKLWRATYAKDGVSIDLSTWNAPAEKGAPVSRTDPPFSPAELKRIVTAEEWKPVVAAVPDSSEDRGTTLPEGADPGNRDDAGKQGGSGEQDGPAKQDEPGKQEDTGKQDDPGKPTSPERDYAFDAAAVRSTFLSLLPGGLEVTAKSEDGSEYAYAVVDDGKGATLVEVNAQPNMKDVEGQLFSGEFETLPDGTKVTLRQKRGDKPGEKWWTVDTMRPDGYRVVVSAWNKATAHGDLTRTEPALSMEQLRAMATSEKWLALKTPAN
ncbi:hypothetical protein I3F58_14130 [Streptomyces sp. MUM 203J]|uniref:hypothetical protein n=1 Tax=Streptomyces sp. MUM 203J TaxID=2791990 RepID=UPI001F042172|nr:hypothetical protein [Streptomyces sp. MUM 203J]MCH0540684.1 hypothetical protein [Streptomyces sp. MUM 203J]